MSIQPSCCGTPKPKPVSSCCDASTTPEKQKKDVIFWGGLLIVTAGYLFPFVFGHDHSSKAGVFAAAVQEFVNMMLPGIVLGVLAMAALGRVPREFVMSVLGSGKGVRGIFRAAFAGVLLDLCSHGILMVGAKLYERGATAGQLMAFLISSPWNSLSLTFVLVAMIGLKWTLAFIVLSMVIGIISGIIFDKLVAGGTLPSNPYHHAIDPDFRFWAEAKKQLSAVQWTLALFGQMLKSGLLDSKMIIRWLFLGVIIAAALRTFVPPDAFATYFGPGLLGLGVTLLAATVIEVCSEGSAPIAADILNRAGAVGNGFTFLMAGVSTDYTEIMVLREVTKSWKLALFLPLVTVPQILVVGYILNHF